MSPLTCLVAGATGATGREITRFLVGSTYACQKVILLTRSKDIGSTLSAIIDQKPAEVVQIVAEDYETKSGNLQNIFKNNKIDIVFTAMGTSRANLEVQASMESDGPGLGFEKWLKTVDLGQNLALAEVAVQNGVKLFSRISARSSNPDGDVDPNVQWSYYGKYQGLSDRECSKLPFPNGVHILKPGRLERGEELRSKRSWEIEHYKNAGPGLSVELVALKAVKEAFESVRSNSSGVKIIEQSEIESVQKSEL